MNLNDLPTYDAIGQRFKQSCSVKVLSLFRSIALALVHQQGKTNATEKSNVPREYVILLA
jgi:hypothetical protein